MWQGTCVDANPCLVNNGGCDANAVCADLPAPAPGFANSTGRRCTCGAGYYGDGDNCTAVIPIGSVRITFVFNISATAASNTTWQHSLIAALAADTARPADVFGVVSVSVNPNAQGQAVVVIGVAGDIEANVPATVIADRVVAAAASPTSQLSQFPVVGQPTLAYPPTEQKGKQKALSDLSVVGIILLVFFVSGVIFTTIWSFATRGRSVPRASQPARAKPDAKEATPAHDTELATSESGQGHQEDVTVQ